MKLWYYYILLIFPVMITFDGMMKAIYHYAIN